MKVNLSHDNAFQRIEKIRNYIGCSKKDFSSMLEISPAALNNINVNKRSLSSDLIIKLIDLKVSPIFIYFGIGTPFDEKYNQFLESYNDYKNEIVDEKDNDLE
ncbi:helix-turn-helix transcriptional regulator, partial [Sulfurimonas sp.]|uniref:helix-turn-helix domain-containing protein n=1 Tax=Sulfurimonas sp. TaxID=2022749 RepID=UPI0025F8DBB4